jgi:heterodisulfide reductase subunit A
MTAALAIAEQGFPVVLVEQAGDLGGNLRWRHHTLDGQRPELLLAETIAKVNDHPRVHVQKSARVIASRGSLGRFATTIEKEDGTAETIGHGITILATGGQEATTQSYGYGSSDRIVTQGELEQMLNDETRLPAKLSSVAMIQCVGSREEPRNYCSRVCCASALKNALFLKKGNPDIDVTIFYRDLMSYGFMETYYTQARRAGVVFIPYSVESKPRMILENDRPILTGIDPVLQRAVKVEADLLVLSTGIIPGNSRQLAETFGVEIDEDGFFQEAESKWRPVEAAKRGVFVCGMAHSPRNIAETVAMAEAAALRALRFLTAKQLSVGTGVVATVEQERCTGCKTCVDLCPYQAITFCEEEKVATIDAMLCQGCGVCAAACPVACISVWNYTPDQMYAQIEGVLTD